LSLAETLNFTKTANQLFITQQAVSKNISRMEESMGFPLFERSHHAVRLTEGGERFYALFSEFVSEYEKAVGEVRRQCLKRATTLQIGYQNWLDFGPEPGSALAELQRDYPDLSVAGQRHSPVILKNLLLSKRLDGIILYARFAPELPGLCKLELLKTPIVLMVAKDDPLVTERACFETFRREPFIFDSLNMKAFGHVRRARRDAEPSAFSRSGSSSCRTGTAYTARSSDRRHHRTEIIRIAYSSTFWRRPHRKGRSIMGIWRRRRPTRWWRSISAACSGIRRPKELTVITDSAIEGAVCYRAGGSEPDARLSPAFSFGVSYSPSAVLSYKIGGFSTESATNAKGIEVVRTI
jgi:DNA-binding transcriptional LysR family regulator